MNSAFFNNSVHTIQQNMRKRNFTTGLWNSVYNVCMSWMMVFTNIKRARTPRSLHKEIHFQRNALRIQKKKRMKRKNCPFFFHVKYTNRLKSLFIFLPYKTVMADDFLFLAGAICRHQITYDAFGLGKCYFLSVWKTCNELKCV